ncbi:MAG: IS5/IS1182 family transposase, partial [Nostoc sp.]
MYRKQGQSPILPGDFKLPFEGKLSEDNRWVILANLIPWAEFEDEYSSS